LPALGWIARRRAAPLDNSGERFRFIASPLVIIC
jgi:hypothetical protein